MNDALLLNEHMNENTPNTNTSPLPHIPDLSPIHQTVTTHPLHTIPLSPITMHSPKIINTDPANNNNHNNIELDIPEETTLVLH